MRIITGITSDARLLQIFAKLEKLADECFGSSAHETTELLIEYDKVTTILESMFAKSLANVFVSDDETYMSLKSSVTDPDKVAIVLTGAYDRATVVPVFDLVVQVLGDKHDYSKKLFNYISTMSEVESVIVWSTGEDKADAILQAVRASN